MTRTAALTAYQRAKQRRDTRAMHDASQRAYAATHAVLRRGGKRGWWAAITGWMRS